MSKPVKLIELHKPMEGGGACIYSKLLHEANRDNDGWMMINAPDHYFPVSVARWKGKGSYIQEKVFKIKNKPMKLVCNSLTTLYKEYLEGQKNGKSL